MIPFSMVSRLVVCFFVPNTSFAVFSVSIAVFMAANASVSSIDSSPNLAGPRLDRAGLVSIQFRRGSGGSPNAARRIPLFIVPGGE